MNIGKLDKSKRLNYVDIAKGIGILLVVFQHCASGGSVNAIPFVTNIITSFYMPFFFFMSGYLYKVKPTKDYVFGKTKGLIVPDIIVLVLNYFTGLFCAVVGFGTNYFELKGYWFLEALFLVSIFYYFVNAFLLKNKLIKNKELIDSALFAISVFVFVVGLVFSSRIEVGPVRVINAFIGIFYFSFGNMFRKFEIKRLNNKCPNLILGVILLLIVIFASQYAGNISMAYNKYGNPLIFVLCSILGSLGILFISKAIAHSKILSYFGKNSLIIITTQFPILGGLRLLLEYVSANYFYIEEIFVVLIDFILTVLFEVIVIFAVNKFFPLFAGKIKYEIK